MKVIGQKSGWYQEVGVFQEPLWDYLEKFQYRLLTLREDTQTILTQLLYVAKGSDIRYGNLLLDCTAFYTIQSTKSFCIVV